MRLSRLSQNIAGVTIMALGNGAPDIFSALAGIGQDRPELVFGEVATLSKLGIIYPNNILNPSYFSYLVRACL